MSPYLVFVLDTFSLFTSLIFDAFAIGHRARPLLSTLRPLSRSDTLFINRFLFEHRTLSRIRRRAVCRRQDLDFLLFLSLFPHSFPSLRSVHCRLLFHPARINTPPPGFAKARQLWPTFPLTPRLRLHLDFRPHLLSTGNRQTTTPKRHSCVLLKCLLSLLSLPLFVLFHRLKGTRLEFVTSIKAPSSFVVAISA